MNTGHKAKVSTGHWPAPFKASFPIASFNFSHSCHGATPKLQNGATQIWVDKSSGTWETTNKTGPFMYSITSGNLRVCYGKWSVFSWLKFIYLLKWWFSIAEKLPGSYPQWFPINRKSPDPPSAAEAVHLSRSDARWVALLWELWENTISIERIYESHWICMNMGNIISLWVIFAEKNTP